MSKKKEHCSQAPRPKDANSVNSERRPERGQSDPDRPLSRPLSYSFIAVVKCKIKSIFLVSISKNISCGLLHHYTEEVTK